MRIRKSRALGTKKQVLLSGTCKYNLWRKADTLLQSLNRPGKVSRLLRVQEMRCGKCIQKKSNCISITRKERAKHDGFCLPYDGQVPRLRILGNIKKTLLNYWLVLSLPPEMKLLLVLVKIFWKTEIELFS